MNIMLYGIGRPISAVPLWSLKSSSDWWSIEEYQKVSSLTIEHRFEASTAPPIVVMRVLQGGKIEVLG